MDVLRTARLRLRWFRQSDAAFVRGLLNEPAWIDAHRRAESAPTSRARPGSGSGWRRATGCWASVSGPSSGWRTASALGLAGVIQREGLPHPDIGYGFPARFWGQGYAREAAAATFDYCRRVLGMRHLLGTTAPENEPSGRVLLAIGMTDEGLQQTEAHEGLSRVCALRTIPRAGRRQGDRRVARPLPRRAARAGAGGADGVRDAGDRRS